MSVNPDTDVSAPFNARFSGQCGLDTCERGRRIDQGDVVQYLQDYLMHMACARRVVREQAAPLCQRCWLYHQGDCT